uniref:Tubulin-specific chaperone D n=1 Tax=Rhabditophanes sp. KR3021 TaxID=114890 RepID=A0AC35TTT9_9BILA
MDEAIGLVTDRLQTEHKIFIEDSIKQIPQSHNDVNAFRFFKYKLFTYYEKPFLLDEYLGEWISQIVDLIKLPDNAGKEKIDQTAILGCMYLAVFIEISGFKSISNHLPHEVDYLEKLVSAIEQVHIMDFADFSGQVYLKGSVQRGLFAWLYITAKNPFNLSRFDNTGCVGDNSIASRIIKVCEDNIMGDRLCAKISTKIWAQLVTRSDQIGAKLTPTVRYCEEKIMQTIHLLGANFELSAYLSLLATIFKEGPRDHLALLGEDVIKRIEELMDLKHSGNYSRVLVVKLAQRIALSFLKPKIAKWRYNRGLRSLEDTLKNNENQLMGVDDTPEQKEEDYGSENDCSDGQYAMLEKIINTLFVGLRDENSEVRYSSAKGLGRITSRLSVDYAEDVINQVFNQCFKSNKSSCWHGGALAIAEMTHRGFILPHQIGKIVDVLEKAIVWEDPLGIMKQDESVRDAATYISWAMARTYSKELLQPYVSRLAFKLVTVSLFDKELNVRRAASAAFQENVGRQGYFPSGIDIIQIIDYSSISRLSVCYNELCVKVAKFKEYLRPMMDHLIQYKVGHQLVKMNSLASQALFHIVKLDVAYTNEVIVPKLFKKLEVKDGQTFYEVIIVLERVIASLLEEKAFGWETHEMQNMFTRVKEINEFLTKKVDTPSKTKEIRLMRCAFCYFVKICSSTKADLSHEVYVKWLKLLENCAEDDDVEVRENGAMATKSWMEAMSDNMTEDIEKRLAEKYRPGMKTSKQGVTLNKFILMIDSLPSKFHTAEIGTELVNFIQDGTRSRLIESRVYALISIENRFIKTGKFERCTGLFECLLGCIRDFTTDPAKGDIGRLMRTKAIQTTLEYVRGQAYTMKSSISETELLIGELLIQTCGKDVNIRADAAMAVNEILNIQPIIEVVDRELLVAAFCLKDMTFVEGFSYLRAYDILKQLLPTPFYGKYVRFGLAMTAGFNNGKDTDTVSQMFEEYLCELGDEEKEGILIEFSKELVNKKAPARVKRNLLQFLAEQLNLMYFEYINEDLESNKGANKIFEYCIFLVNNPKTTNETATAAASFLCYLITIEEASNRKIQGLTALCDLLSKGNSVAAFETAKKMIEAFNSAFDRYSEEELQIALDVLGNTDWGGKQQLKNAATEKLRKIFNL